MDKETLQAVIEASQRGWTLTEIITAVTASICCLITTYAFIRSVIRTGFETLHIQNELQSKTLEKQEKTLEKIDTTINSFRTDSVTHHVCQQRQDNLIKRLGLGDLRDRIRRLEDKIDKHIDKKE